MAGEEAVGPVEVLARDQQIAAPAFDESPAAILAHRVSQGGAEIAADGAGRGRGDQAEIAERNQVSRKWHDDFRGQRNAGGFDCHHQHDAAKPEGRDRRDNEGGKRANNSLEQALSFGWAGWYSPLRPGSKWNGSLSAGVR